MTMPNPADDSVTGTPLPVPDRAEHIVSVMRDHLGIVETDTCAILLDCPVIPLYHKQTGELIGYETYVRMFDAEGDLGVDPHRQFINPPDGRRKLDDGTIIEAVDTVTLVEEALRQTVTP